MDSLLNSLAFNLNLNNSPYPKKILMKLRGNESGQIKHVPAYTSVVMPDNANYRFWDA